MGAFKRLAVFNSISKKIIYYTVEIVQIIFDVHSFKVTLNVLLSRLCDCLRLTFDINYKRVFAREDEITSLLVY